MAKKIVLLGGGSLFFRTVLIELAMTEELSDCEVVLYDVTTERTVVMERFGKQASTQRGANLRIWSTDNLSQAVDGADFAVSSIGVSGPNRIWHELDITLPAKYGIFQTTGDTTGSAGLMAGFRSIPIFLEIAREMERRCPEVVFLNHSNPMVMICRALTKHTGIRNVIGLCHGVQGTIHYLAQVLEIPAEELDTIAVGLNHMLWLTQIRHRGKDLYPTLREKLFEADPPEGQIFARKLFEIYGYYPVNADRHIIEFFPFLRSAQTPEELPYRLRLRTELIRDARNGMGETWQNLERQANGEEPITFPEKTSPEATGQLIADIALARRNVYIVNIPNQGSIPNLPDYTIVEVQGVTEGKGVRGLYMGEIPLAVAGFLQARALQQELAVDAAVFGDRKIALQALLADEQTLSIEEAEALLDELLTTHREQLPQFRIS